MKNKIFSAAILMIGFFSHTYAQVSAGNDTTICQGNSVTLHAESDSAGAVTQLNLPDDTYSQPVDIGFSFSFFGTTYTQCLLSTNVYIAFDLGDAGLYSQWPINDPIPSNANPTNAIMGPWHDVDPSVPTYGIMSYATMGTAPNRFFVFNFCNVPEFQCNSLLYTGQIIIYEGTNIIETHIIDKPICTSWNNGGAAIHGLHDPTGTVAFTVPGRNYPTIWTASNDGYRFTPDAATTNYTIAPITFAPVTMLGAVQWIDISGVFLSNDQDLLVSPSVTTSYIALVELCNGNTTTDTVTVTVVPGSATYALDNTTCAQSVDGYAAFIPQDTSTWTYLWEDAVGTDLSSGVISQLSDTLFNLGVGQYTVTLTNLAGCTLVHYFNISSDIAGIPILFSQGNASCPLAPDAWAAFLPQDTATWNFVWENAAGNGLDSGIVNQQADTLFNLVVGQYTVTLTNSIGCIASHTYTIQAGTFNAVINVSANPLCDAKPVNFSSSSVGSIDNFSWTFGDGGVSTLQSVNHTYTPAGNYNVILIISNTTGCIDTATVTVSILPNIIANFSFIPLEGCAGSPIDFSDESNQFPVGWDWNFGDSQNSTSENPIHVFDADGTYQVILTVTDSLCGVDSKTLPIVIHFVPDPYIGNDTSVCKFEILNLNAGYPGTTYQWSTGETTQVIKPALPNHDTYYSVIVNNFGCLGYDTMLAVINCDVIMPSGFSPNGDGSNDIFRPLGYRITNYTMTIYDRWGGIIYLIDAPDVSQGWNGKFKGEDAEVGVYVYNMNATFINGEQKTITGNVTLVR